MGHEDLCFTIFITIIKQSERKNRTRAEALERKSGRRTLAKTFLLSARHDRGFGITQRNFHSEKLGGHVSYIDQTNPLGESMTAPCADSAVAEATGIVP